MIDRQHRDIAANVAAGGPAPELPSWRDGRDAHVGMQKAYAYGVTAKALSRIAMPTVQEILGGYRPGHVSSVTALLQDELKRRFFDLLKDDMDLEYELNDATNHRYHITSGARLGDDAGRLNIESGINTAVDVEALTLATIKKQTESGRPITHGGLRKSQRVPYLFAMQSLANHDLETKALFERVYLPDANSSGCERKEKVIRTEAIEMSPTKGLRLINGVPTYKGRSSFANEPAVGCPATLVKNFVYDLHAVAADACVETGIIPVVEVEASN